MSAKRLILTTTSLLAALTLATACTDRDREQAARKSDGVDTFRYQPGDTKKYIKKAPSQAGRSAGMPASPAVPPDGAGQQPAPDAPGK
jgi:hypothetical protein